MTAVATATPGSWVADRWNVLRFAYAAGGVMGQGTNLTTGDMPFSDAGIKTFARVGRLSGNIATGGIFLNYNMESQDCYRFIGKPVTLSFYYRTGANFSGTSIFGIIRTGTSIDEGQRNGFTGAVTAGTSTYNSNTSWKKISLTCTLGTNINQIGLEFGYNSVGTAGAADYFDITGVQLELGSVATPFEVRPFPVELQMCMRYYEKSYLYNVAPGSNSVPGFYDLIIGTNEFGNAVFTIKIAPKRSSNYNVTSYTISGNINTWTYVRSGTSSTSSTPGIDSKSEMSFRFIVPVGTAYVIAEIQGHLVVDAEM
jgi:hypothetical protein